jgi:hypothetical protein
MTSLNSQLELFEFLKKKHKNANWLHSISSILNISKEAVYKKARGETNLHLSEWLTLQKKFNFSFDQFLVEKGFITFRSIDAFSEQLSFLEFILSVKKIVNFIATQEQVTLNIITNEISILNLFNFPYLLYYKFCLSMNKVPDKNEMNEILRNKDLVTELNNIASLYDRIKTLEIWSFQKFELLINQIKYSKKLSGSDDILFYEKIVQDYKNYIRFIKLKLDSENEYKKNTFNVFLNDNSYFPNYYILESNDIKICALMIDSVNLISTKNVKLCEQLKLMAAKVVKKSNRISYEGEIVRNMLFSSVANSLAVLVD